MVKLWQLDSGRWSALLMPYEIGKNMPLMHIDVKIYRDAEHFSSDTVSLATKDGKKCLQYGVPVSFTRPSDLSKSDAESRHLLVLAKEELCLHLLCGGSVEEWCKQKGLKVQRGTCEMPRDGNRPKGIVVQWNVISLPPQELTAKDKADRQDLADRTRGNRRTTVMSDRKQTNIDRINELWGLHEHWDETSVIEGLCLAFVIDRRYIDGYEGTEYRLAISFGHNVVSPETRQGLIGIPVHPGKFIFGFHLVGIRGNRVALLDKWQDAQDAGDSADAVQGEKRARAILDSISDERYIGWVSADGYEGPVKVSSLHLLEDLEIVKTEELYAAG